MGAYIEPIVGRYAHIDIGGRTHRVYFEEAGQGIPLVCLHTAGSDGRQYRALLNSEEVTRDYRVIVFDMPWHGKSSPPPGWQNEVYRLTSQSYVEQVLAVTHALELDRPVVMGCSIGGRIVLHLAQQHPGSFRAVIGLQSSTHVDPYYDVDWLHRPDVHGGEVCGAVAFGLTAPLSPDEHRYETVWHYMQGGPGIFKGDLYFYKVDGDIREQVGAIDPSVCPLYLLTGDYDFSCTPADTQTLADAINSRYKHNNDLSQEQARSDSAHHEPVAAVIMKNMGHFPMSEHPQQFLTYLQPVLDTIKHHE